MNRLIVNTANEKLFIVLQKENNVFCKENLGKSRHNEIMLPLIEELLNENNLTIQDIDEFGVVVGPGSFTGIRVGGATIKSFRDSLNVKTKGVNNLDYLFKLAEKQYGDINFVAMIGSKDSYFVARKVNDVVYKYDRNLTKEELENIIKEQKVAMFTQDENLNCVVVSDDAYVLLECLKDSQDEELTPVYYQLSQAENEKLKRGEIQICLARNEDVDDIFEIEQNSIRVNTLSKNEIKDILNNDSYTTFKVLFNSELVGFIILEITDEVNVYSIAVKKSYRNLGLATKLIEAAKKYCYEKSIKILSLEVSSKNITAYLLYEKLGFRTRRIRKNYYQDGSDCFEMFMEV